MAYLKQINIYPVKSLAGLSLECATVGERGLDFDRCLMLVDAKGKFLTARKFPSLLAITTELIDGGVVIKATEQPSLTVLYSDFGGTMPVTLWREELLLKVAAVKVNQWFSAVLKQDTKLVMLTDEHHRYRDKLEQQVNLSDGYPILLIGEGSLAELNRRAGEASLMTQFRTNLVIGDSDAFAEDCWQEIRIGKVTFELKTPCERCVMTTVDLNDYQPRKSKEPLVTLTQFRADPKGRLMFGENLIAKNVGVINVGDEVEILATRTSVIYSNK